MKNMKKFSYLFIAILMFVLVGCQKNKEKIIEIIDEPTIENVEISKDSSDLYVDFTVRQVVENDLHFDVNCRAYLDKDLKIIDDKNPNAFVTIYDGTKILATSDDYVNIASFSTKLYIDQQELSLKSTINYDDKNDLSRHFKYDKFITMEVEKNGDTVNVKITNIKNN